MDERLVSGYERCSSSLGLFFAKIALSLASGRSPQQNTPMSELAGNQSASSVADRC
jgi:hypothetical protein